jgi:hypothetical protein
MNRRQAAVDEAGGDEELLFADGFDDAIMGVGVRDGQHIVVYDEELVIDILATSGMSYDEAREFFDFNVSGAYVGPRTPMFVRRLDDDQRR